MPDKDPGSPKPEPPTTLGHGAYTFDRGVILAGRLIVRAYDKLKTTRAGRVLVVLLAPFVPLTFTVVVIGTWAVLSVWAGLVLLWDLGMWVYAGGDGL